MTDYDQLEIEGDEDEMTSPAKRTVVTLTIERACTPHDLVELLGDSSELVTSYRVVLTPDDPPYF